MATAKKIVKVSSEKPAAKKAAPSKKAAPKIPLVKAPQDFKPSFFEVNFSTGKDSLIKAGSFKVERVKGRWDNAESQRFDLATYDTHTLIQVAARISSVTFAPNLLKRLPPAKDFMIVYRIGRKVDSGVLTAKVIAAAQSNDAGKLKWFKDKKDKVYGKLRKSGKIMPSAFSCVQLPPKRSRKKDSEE